MAYRCWCFWHTYRINSPWRGAIVQAQCLEKKHHDKSGVANPHRFFFFFFNKLIACSACIACSMNNFGAFFFTSLLPSSSSFICKLAVYNVTLNYKYFASL